MKWSPVIVFFLTYALFLVSGFLFRLDRAWYDALAKPSWTPSGGIIGIVWSVLFFCIALSLAVLDWKVGIANLGWALTAAIVVNWLSNQAYTYFQFTRHDWFGAGIDSGVVALSAFVVAMLAWRLSKVSSLLFVPYALWASFATYLSFLIWSMNR
ncbi:MAG TPA: tryptophan-rich sensory protein [Coriobacteriia bacterium]